LGWIGDIPFNRAKLGGFNHGGFIFFRKSRRQINMDPSRFNQMFGFVAVKLYFSSSFECIKTAFLVLSINFSVPWVV
jgi:hypothetical protein